MPEDHSPQDALDATRWLDVMRSSHDRFVALTGGLGPAAVEQQSYDDEWTIAQVASHLGSQAEIHGLLLTAGLEGDPAPGQDVFSEIWGRWDARPPAEQVAESITVNEALVTRFESLSDEQRTRFALEAFGMSLDLAGLARLRVAEHAVHTWDVAVALDPTAEIAADAVDLLVDTLGDIVAYAGKPGSEPATVAIRTTEPVRNLRLTTGPSMILEPAMPGAADAADGAELRIPAAALIRLVYGRLDPEHSPPALADDPVVTELRAMFPGV